MRFRSSWRLEPNRNPLAFAGRAHDLRLGRSGQPPNGNRHMNRPKLALLPIVGILIVVDVAGLSRSVAHVRAVDAVGLSGAGFALGVAAVLLVLCFMPGGKAGGND